ncbi:unnamed protein product [Polarella glacialis]|uniref:Apple domain-containing protein n=1 Tax=Polarella glacialis TaxID=89957 RepID=A0A813FGD5_POLGL|nr:unnamed protein product [Polarella glacialis]CAE8610943.1 unnamed protein product [Polarella glacialis]
MMSSRSIKGLTLLLAVSAAGAVQPDSCEGGCKGARAQVLLQTGSVGRYRFSARGSGEEFKDVQRVASMSLTDQSALVEDLVTDVLATGQPLTGTQKEIIERLNETFVTEKLPELQRLHDSDQELLNVHAATVAHCDVDLETNSQRVSTLNSDQNSTESAHTECLAQEASLQSSEKLKHEELTAYLKSLQPPSSMMPEQRAPTPAMDDFVAQNLEFFKSLNSSYVSLKERISTVQAEVEAKTAGCAEAELVFDEKFCLWKTEVENAKSNYLNCRTATLTLYNETLKTAHSNAESRRADLAAVLKVQCFLKMLLDGTTQEKLKECTDAEHTSSALDIAEPQLPELNQRVLDGLGAPGSRVQCTATALSVQQHYVVHREQGCAGPGVYGTSIQTWGSGEDSADGAGYVDDDLEGCEAGCSAHSDCAGFVLRDSDKRCSFWYSGPLSPLAHSGYHCYEKISM